MQGQAYSDGHRTRAPLLAQFQCNPFRPVVLKRTHFQATEWRDSRCRIVAVSACTGDAGCLQGRTRVSQPSARGACVLVLARPPLRAALDLSSRMAFAVCACMQGDVAHAPLAEHGRRKPARHLCLHGARAAGRMQVHAKCGRVRLGRGCVEDLHR